MRIILIVTIVFACDGNYLTVIEAIEAILG